MKKIFLYLFLFLLLAAAYNRDMVIHKVPLLSAAYSKLGLTKFDVKEFKFSDSRGVIREDITLPTFQRGNEQNIFQFLYSLENYDRLIRNIFIFTGILSLLAMSLLRKSPYLSCALTFVDYGFRVSNFLIFLTILITPISLFFLRYNYFYGLNGLFFTGPYIMLVLTSISLKVYDFNMHVWNRLVYSLVCLTVSAVIARTYL